MRHLTGTLTLWMGHVTYQAQDSRCYPAPRGLSLTRAGSVAKRAREKLCWMQEGLNLEAPAGMGQTAGGESPNSPLLEVTDVVGEYPEVKAKCRAALFGRHGFPSNNHGPACV